MVIALTSIQSPYSTNILLSGFVEKEIPYKDGRIFILKFNDKSSAMVIYDERNKTCIGREYEGKYRCKFILSLVDKYIATHNQEGASNSQQSAENKNHNEVTPKSPLDDTTSAVRPLSVQ